MANGQKKMGRFEPATGIDDNVVRAAGIGVDDKPVNLSKILAGWALDLHAVEIHALILEVVGGQILQPGVGMSHSASSLRACAQEGRARGLPSEGRRSG